MIDVSQDDLDYAHRITRSTLVSIATADPGGEGWFDFELAVDGILGAVAELMVQGGDVPDLATRREFAEGCRDVLLDKISRAIEQRAAEAGPDWPIEPRGRLN